MLRNATRNQVGRRSAFVQPLARRHASTAPPTPPSSVGRTLGLVTFTVTGVALTVYYLDSRSAVHRYVIPPLLRATVDAETAHKFAVKALASGLGPRDTRPDDAKLETELWGYKLDNPVSLAAGFDKDAEAIDGLFNLGFSWVEIGSVTPKPQPGNPQPRVFHLPEDNAMINRYGFPSVGFPLVLSRLRSYFASHSSTSPPNHILAVNLGKNKSSAPDSVTDYINGVQTLGPYADVLVINVSSPNTPGLRGLQSRGLLIELLSEVTKARNALPKRTSAAKWEQPKVVVKIAPDLNDEEISDIAEAVLESGIDGVIVSNTTISRPNSLTPHENVTQTGGLSGPPLLPLSLHALSTLRTLLPSEIPIFGAGGISSGADALAFARAGASLVQVYTSFGYGGVGTPRRIKDELVKELEKEGVSWKQTVATALKEKAGSGIERAKQEREERGERLLRSEAEELRKEAESYLALLKEREEKEEESLAESVVEGAKELVDDVKGAIEGAVSSVVEEGSKLVSGDKETDSPKELETPPVTGERDVVAPKVDKEKWPVRLV